MRATGTARMQGLLRHHKLGSDSDISAAVPNLGRLLAVPAEANLVLSSCKRRRKFELIDHFNPHRVPRNPITSVALRKAGGEHEP